MFDLFFSDRKYFFIIAQQKNLEARYKEYQNLKQDNLNNQNLTEKEKVKIEAFCKLMENILKKSITDLKKYCQTIYNFEVKVKS